MENNNTIKSAEEINQDSIAFFSNPVKTEKVLYTAKTFNTGGRNGGHSHSEDGRLEITLTPPGKKGGKGTNPEQLFAAGWSACFIDSLRIAAAKTKTQLPDDLALETEIDLSTDSKSYFLQARLNVSLPGLEREVAMDLIKSAHETCPYSKATHGNINVTIRLI